MRLFWIYFVYGSFFAGLAFPTEPILSVYSTAKNPDTVSGWCSSDGFGTHCVENGKWVLGIPPLKAPTHLAAGDGISCALDEGDLKCWGRRIVGNFTSLGKGHHFAAGQESFCFIEDEKTRCYDFSGQERLSPVHARVSDLVIASIPKERWYAMTESGLISFDLNGKLTEYPDFPKGVALLVQKSDYTPGYPDLIRATRDKMVYQVENDPNKPPLTISRSYDQFTRKWPAVEGNALKLIGSSYGYVCAINEQKELTCSNQDPKEGDPFPIKDVEDVTFHSYDRAVLKKISGRIGTIWVGNHFGQYTETEGPEQKDWKFISFGLWDVVPGVPAGVMYQTQVCLRTKEATLCYRPSSFAEPEFKSFVTWMPITRNVTGFLGNSSTACFTLSDGTLQCRGEKFTLPAETLPKFRKLVQGKEGFWVDSSNQIGFLDLKGTRKWAGAFELSDPLPQNHLFGTNEGHAKEEVWFHDGKSIWTLSPGWLKYPEKWNINSASEALVNGANFLSFSGFSNKISDAVWYDGNKVVACGDYQTASFPFSNKGAFQLSYNSFFLLGLDGHSGRVIQNASSAYPKLTSTQVFDRPDALAVAGFGGDIYSINYEGEISAWASGKQLTGPPLSERLLALRDAIDYVRVLSASSIEVEGKYLDVWLSTLKNSVTDSKMVYLGFSALLEYFEKIEPPDRPFLQGALARIQDLIANHPQPLLDLSLKQWMSARIREHLAGIEPGINKKTLSAWTQLVSKLAEIEIHSHSLVEFEKSVRPLEQDLRKIEDELKNTSIASRRNSVLKALIKEILK